MRRFKDVQRRRFICGRPKFRSDPSRSVLRVRWWIRRRNQLRHGRHIADYVFEKRDDGIRIVYMQRLGEAIRSGSRDVHLEMRRRAALGVGRRRRFVRVIVVVVVVRRSLRELSKGNQVVIDSVRVDLRVLLARIVRILESVHSLCVLSSRHLRQRVECD